VLDQRHRYLNARYRRAVKARGHFPTEQAMKCLYLVTRSPRPRRARQGMMDHAVEASAQRVRHHLRRPLAGSRNLLMKPPEPPLTRQSRVDYFPKSVTGLASIFRAALVVA